MRSALAWFLLATACSSPAFRGESTSGATEELVGGLRANERALFVDVVRDDAFAELRVVDAATCRPLEGARVETWTEDGTPPARLPVLVDDARTARDGTVRVRWIVGDARAATFRISKGGFESRVTSSPLGETVWLQRAAPLGGRVLDLDLEPVVGAIVRTRQCCAHAVSAATTRTDDDGYFVLEDVPVGEDEGAEIEVLHERTTAWAELEPLVLRQIGEHDPLAHGRGAAVLVARSVPWRARLLDPEGKPLARRRVGSPNWRPSVAAWTDADGVCELPLVDAYSRDVETMDAGPSLHWLQSTLPSGVLLDLAPSEGALRADSKASFELVAPSEQEYRALQARTPDSLEAQVLPSGRVETPWPSPGESRAVFGPGNGTLVLGRAFSGWCEEHHALKPDSIARDVRFTPRVERAIALSVPSWALAAYVVQAGANGLVEPGVDWAQDVPHEVFVPPGPAITIACASTTGELRRARVAAGMEPMTADLAGAESVIRAAFGEHEHEHVRETAALFGFPPVARDLTGTIWPAGASSFDFVDGGFELPRGRWYFAVLHAPGFCPVRVLRRAGDPPSMQAVRWARVRVTGKATRVEAFGRELDELEGGGRGFAYSGVPGPLRLFVTRTDGVLVRVDLELAPGDEREIAMR
ncbi:MAG: carboxypeptidase regulatory-like domain-containing protein [Planctomycetes bacterium]|nr:carboxypeptidase regulatory-like domain-containing protein [Planctomycetota bacterium]